MIALAGMLVLIFFSYIYIVGEQAPNSGAGVFNYLVVLLVFIGFATINTLIESVGLIFMWYVVSIFVVFSTHIMFGGSL